MIIIWGFRSYLKFLGIFTAVCRRCGNPAAHRAQQLVRKFTFFWVPLFPVKKQVVVTCTFCGLQVGVPRKDEAAFLEALRGTPAPGAQPVPPVTAQDPLPSPAPMAAPHAAGILGAESAQDAAPTVPEPGFVPPHLQ